MVYPNFLPNIFNFYIYMYVYVFKGINVCLGYINIILKVFN